MCVCVYTQPCIQQWSLNDRVINDLSLLHYFAFSIMKMIVYFISSFLIINRMCNHLFFKKTESGVADWKLYWIFHKYAQGKVIIFLINSTDMELDINSFCAVFNLRDKQKLQYLRRIRTNQSMTYFIFLLKQIVNTHMQE